MSPISRKEVNDHQAHQQEHLPLANGLPYVMWHWFELSCVAVSFTGVASIEEA